MTGGGTQGRFYKTQKLLQFGDPQAVYNLQQLKVTVIFRILAGVFYEQRIRQRYLTDILHQMEFPIRGPGSFSSYD